MLRDTKSRHQDTGLGLVDGPCNTTGCAQSPRSGRTGQGELSHSVLPHRSYLSSADPGLWLLVSREKTLRSFRGRVGGDEGGVNPTSVDLENQTEQHYEWLSLPAVLNSHSNSVSMPWDSTS